MMACSSHLNILFLSISFHQGLGATRGWCPRWHGRGEAAEEARHWRGGWPSWPDCTRVFGTAPTAASQGERGWQLLEPWQCEREGSFAVGDQQTCTPWFGVVDGLYPVRSFPRWSSRHQKQPSWSWWSCWSSWFASQQFEDTFSSCSLHCSQDMQDLACFAGLAGFAGRN